MLFLKLLDKVTTKSATGRLGIGIAGGENKHPRYGECCLINPTFLGFRKNLKSLRKRDGSTHRFLRQNSTTRRGKSISSGVVGGIEEWLQKLEKNQKS